MITAKTNMISAIAVIAVLFSSVLGLSNAAHAAIGDNPYIAAYGLDGTTIHHADKAFQITYFYYKGTAPNNKPTVDLLAVLSLAGSTSGSGSTGVTGFVYQSVVQWDIDQKIYVPDQVHGPNSDGNGYALRYPTDQELPGSWLCDRAKLSRITSNPIWSSDKSKVTFQHTCYETVFTYTSQKPYNKSYWANWDMSTYFLFGQCGSGNTCNVNWSPKIVKFFQFGVEADVQQTAGFQAKQTNTQYFDCYDFSCQTVLLSNKHGKLTHAYITSSLGSYITWYYDTGQSAQALVHVGGTSFNKVYAQAKLTDGTQTAGNVQWDSGRTSPSSCSTRCQAEGTNLW